MVISLNKKKVEKVEEEWIWVEGYKGTNKDMTCYGYQYELGKQHDMPEDSKIKECESGFHFCVRLNDVFGYYGIGNDNRYFKVKALVRESDYLKTKSWNPFEWKDKLVSKSIIFERELTDDEILTDEYLSMHPIDGGWTTERKKAALKHSIRAVARQACIDELTKLGYSEKLAEYIIDCDRYDFACALGTQQDISMDTRVNLIFASHPNPDSVQIKQLF